MYLDIFVNFLTTRICKKKFGRTMSGLKTEDTLTLAAVSLLEYYWNIKKNFLNLQVWEPAVVLLILLVVVSEHVRAEKSLNLLIIFNTNFAQKSLYLEYDGFC